METKRTFAKYLHSVDSTVKWILQSSGFYSQVDSTQCRFYSQVDSAGKQKVVSTESNLETDGDGG